MNKEGFSRKTIILGVVGLIVLGILLNLVTIFLLGEEEPNAESDLGDSESQKLEDQSLGGTEGTQIPDLVSCGSYDSSKAVTNGPFTEEELNTIECFNNKLLSCEPSSITLFSKDFEGETKYKIEAIDAENCLITVLDTICEKTNCLIPIDDKTCPVPVAFIKELHQTSKDQDTPHLLITLVSSLITSEKVTNTLTEEEVSIECTPL